MFYKAYIKIIWLICLLLISIKSISQLQQVTNFGTNPGNLKMFVYIPQNIQPSAKLIIALHGCTQNASEYSYISGWDSIAKKHNCIIIYPEQQFFNNTSYCFNWFLSADQIKDSGEPLSIKQMVDFIKSNYSIDNSKVFITGLSAGAGMTSIMIACYPEIFSKAAIFAGGPYKAASDAITAYSVMSGNVTKTPEEWKALVISQNPTYNGTYPKVAIFHGLNDNTVSPNNVFELVKQWTAVHESDTIRDSSIPSFNNNQDIIQSIYLNNSDDTIVYTYRFFNLAHAITVDPGTCSFQGGNTNTYSIDKDFYSTYWVARFFNIITIPKINGLNVVSVNQENIQYSIDGSLSSTYNWHLPSGAIIISGQNTNSIIVNWGQTSGYITVTEIDINNCINPTIQLYVNTSTVINLIYNNSKIYTFPNPCNNQIYFSKTLEGYVKIYSYDSGMTKMFNIINNSIDVSGLVPGIYFLQFYYNNQTFNNKIIINK